MSNDITNRGGDGSALVPWDAIAFRPITFPDQAPHPIGTGPGECLGCPDCMPHLDIWDQ